MGETNVEDKTSSYIYTVEELMKSEEPGVVQEGSSEGVTFKPCLQEVKDTALEKMVDMNLGRKNSICKGSGAESNLALCEEERLPVSLE